MTKPLLAGLFGGAHAALCACPIPAAIAHINVVLRLLIYAQKEAGKKPSKPAPQNMVRGPPKPGKEPIYVGFGKE